MPIFLMLPAIWAGSIAVSCIAVGVGVIVLSNATGGGIARAAGDWVDRDERRKFKNSDLYKDEP